MSFWSFGQAASSDTDFNRLLDVYYAKRSKKPQQQGPQQGNHHTPQLNNMSFQYNSDSDEVIDELNETPIDRQFVYKLLDDPGLLQELQRQNNKLIDLICFGYIDPIIATDELDDNDNDNDNDNENDNDNDNDTNSSYASPSAAAPFDTNLASGGNSPAEQSPLREAAQQQQPQQQGVSILEVLIDLIVDSVAWFEKNHSALFNFSEGVDDDDIPHNEITDQFNRIHAASEILSCKIWLVSESLVEEPALLTKLWTFLGQEISSSSPSIQFFININERLLESRPDQMLNFIRSQQNLVDVFLKHVDITMIMDFLLRIIATDKVDNPTGIIDLLKEQDLISKLLNLLMPDVDTSVQSSCGDFLKALISISANTSIDEHTIGPNLLTKELVSEPCVDKMIEIILLRGNGLSTVVGVIIELIRKNNSDYDSVNLLYTTIESHPPNKRDPIYLGKMLKKFSTKMNEFNKILNNSELNSKRIKVQINQEIEPLGFERFKICELVAELLHCSNISLLNNHLTEKIVNERENFLMEQEINLMNALNEDLTPKLSTSNPPSLNISNLNIGGTSLPSVAINSNNVTISPASQPTDVEDESIDHVLPLPDEPLQSGAPENNNTNNSNTTNNDNIETTKSQQLRKNPTIGDYFKIQLIDSGILNSIISMFTRFPWNNFWHNVVFDIVQQIFNGRLDVSFNPYLILELFEKSDITNLIINSYNICTETEQKTKIRLGYMGHLILIAEEVVKFSSIFQNNKFNDTNADNLIYNKLIHKDWIDYVTNVLTETREMYNCVLGGIKTQEFSNNDYLNSNAIILGNSEEEILNQPVDEEQMTDLFYDSHEHEADDRNN